jgi:hypothetical protein
MPYVGEGLVERARRSIQRAGEPPVMGQGYSQVTRIRDAIFVTLSKGVPGFFS